MEQVGVDAATPQAFAVGDSPFDQRASHHRAGREDGVAAAIEPVDVHAHRLGDERVAGQVKRVRAELRVVRAQERDAEQLAHQQPAEADRPGCRELDDVRLELLDAGNDLEQAGKTKLEVLGGGQWEGPFGREDLQPRPLPQRVARRDNHELAVSGRRDRPHRPGHAVRLGEGVGEDQRARRPRGAACAEEDLLELGNLSPRPGVVVGGGEKRRLKRGGEQQARESLARARNRIQSEPAPPCALAQRAGDDGRRLCQLPVLLGVVDAILVQQLLDERGER
jgi:hypothetical protein